jgi:glycosyltransferase involved in cell wall biosynthesis
MRILLIDQFSELGGGQRCLVEAAEGFVARGWELHAAIPEGPLAARLRPMSKSLTTLRCGPFASGNKSSADALRFASQLPGQISVISKIVKNGSVDLLYVNGPRMLPAAAVARRGRPLVFHAHWAPPQRAASALARTALRMSGAQVLASSRFVARAYAGSPTTVIYNGIAPQSSAPDQRKPEVQHVAVLGRVAPEKGQLEFARAARIIAAVQPLLRFTICGAPMFSSNSYFERVRAEADGAVAFREWTDDVAAFLAEVDLLAVPSQAIDNIPRVILEAFAANVPVIAFASGGIPELIENGVTGLLVDQPAPEALAGGILEAVRDPAGLRLIAQRAHARYQSDYTLGRFQSEVCDALEAAVLRKRSPLHNAGANAAA